MKTKNKKKILPILIIALLLFSVFGTVIISAIPGINSWPTTYNYMSNALTDEGRRNSTWSWNISEYFRGFSADESWNVSYNRSNPKGTPWMENDSSWNLDEFSGYDFGSSLMYNNTSKGAYGISFNRADMPFQWAIANYSYMNRSQSIVFARAQNWSGLGFSGEIYYGIIFAANNSTNNKPVSNMTAVLYGPKKCYILNYNNSTHTLYDTLNGTIVNFNTSQGLTNYYNFSWIQNDSQATYNRFGFYNGTWIKTTFNTANGRIQSKQWGNSTHQMLPFLDEPNGWIIDRNLTNVSSVNPVMCGVAVWNPSNVQAAVHFDMFNVWRLNYTTNISSGQAIGGITRPCPRLDFPIMNATVYNTTLLDLFWNKINGNITRSNVTDAWIRVLQNMSHESRFYRPMETTSPQTENVTQNDTIYYSASLITRFNDYADDWFGTNPFDGNPDEILMIWIQDCTQGGASDNTSLFVGIDIENDGDWDTYDRAFLVSGTENTEGSWTGTTADQTTNFYATINVAKDIQNIHRYNNHTNYIMLIPRTELSKGSATSTNYIGQNDTFGLLVLTENTDWDDNIAVLCNWNESTGNPQTSEEADTCRTYFTNMSDIDATSTIEFNTTSIVRWGEGRIGWLPGYSLKGNYSFTVIHSANVTRISSGLNNTTVHLVNYSVEIRNTGTGNITGMQINMTWIDCANGLFNFTWQSLMYNNSNSTAYNNFFNQTSANFSWNNGSAGGYLLINLSNISISGGNGVFFNLSFVVDMRPCDNDTRTTITTTASVTCDREDVTSTDTHEIIWGICQSLRIQARRNVFDIVTTAGTVITIVGIVIIIAAIMAVVGIVYSTREMW